MFISVGTDTHYFKAMAALGFIHFAAALTIRVMLSKLLDSWIKNSHQILDNYRSFNSCIGPNLEIQVITAQFLEIIDFMHQAITIFDVAILFVIAIIIVIAYLFSEHDHEEELKDDDDDYELMDTNNPWIIQ